MGIQTAAVLYPVNTTTVDTGAGIDVRLLDSAEAGAEDGTQDVTFTHTQDNQGRVFDPANSNNTGVNVGTSPPSKGYALRLTEDMTPGDDTNCNAVLTAGDITIGLQMLLNQSGGTYAGGTYGPRVDVALWRYNISANTGTLIGSVQTSSSTTWDYTPVSGDLNTQKVVTITYPIATLVEFSAGEVLLLEVGLNTATVPNPTLGTATWTSALLVDHANTKLTFDTSPVQGIRTLCPIDGTTSGTGDASGVAVQVIPTVGTDAGTSTVTGALQAEANMAGTSAGTVTVSGALQADANMAGTADGVATVTGDQVVVIGTVGTVDIGGGGGDTFGYARSRVVNA